MAATYPIEVVEAGALDALGRHPRLSPQQAVAAAASRNWEPSVQSMVAFSALSPMDEQLEWTQRLATPRRRSRRKFGLQCKTYVSALMRPGNCAPANRCVLHNGPVIVRGASAPEIVYVPTTTPIWSMALGGGWLRAVRWAPQIGYAAAPRLAYLPGQAYLGLGFSLAISIGAVRVVLAPPERRPHYYPRPIEYQPEWRHDPRHRRNVPHPVPPVHIQPTPAVPAPVVLAPAQ